MDVYEEKQKKQKEIVDCLKRNEPLTDKMLEIALNSIQICLLRNCNRADEEDIFSKFLNNISSRMIARQSLSEYEIYVMDDLISSMDYEERRKARKSRGASYGHVKRRLSRNEPLTGKTLELALDLVPYNIPAKDQHDELFNSIYSKLNAGQPLNEYEYHIMVDVLLLHANLSVGDV
ncbi:hypothetical protein [Candidatus Berkiella aquae]|uniref:Uncharacterized protein n=1 Tax=Candidatus Berkiella aquae TaxID=295108 RepID=A0A0Q9YPM7_9GAMM|nr:hypothetical protein [Candidatus Berkiella aquae]MCS5710428.1 hypothetical protein [Candidatus Berkiella aquae]